MMKRSYLTSRIITVLLVLTLFVLSVPASAQAFLTNLTVNPSTVVGGQPSTGTVTLDAVTTTALTIGLASSDPDVVVPGSVTVPAGSSSCTFPITTKKVTSQVTFGIFAVNDKIEKEANITLTVEAIASVTALEGFTSGALPITVKVALQSPAPTGGWTVSLSSSNGNFKLPSSVVVPAGSSSATAVGIFQNCSTYTVVTITAKDSTGTTVTTKLDVNPLFFFNFDGPQGSPTTINGISDTDTIVGFSTVGTTNYNFELSPTFNFTEVNLGDPAGSLNGMNASLEGVGVANGTAVTFKSGTTTPIKISGSTSSIAFGINDAGVIVGQYVNAAGNTPGFVDVNGTITTLLPKSNATVVNPQAVNNHNLVVGFYSINGVNQFPFTYNIATKQYTFPPSPSTYRTVANGLVLTQFLSVNDAGVVAGYYQTNNGSQYGLFYNLNTSSYFFVDDPQAAPVGGVQITQLVGITSDTVTGFYIDATGAMHGFFAK
jgi:hypothetical protein